MNETFRKQTDPEGQNVSRVQTTDTSIHLKPTMRHRQIGHRSGHGDG